MSVEELAREIYDFHRSWEVACKLQTTEACQLARAKLNTLVVLSRQILSMPCKITPPARRTTDDEPF